MSEELTKAGLYIDDFHMLRVLDPDIANETGDLKDECLNYSESELDFFLFFFNFPKDLLQKYIF